MTKGADVSIYVLGRFYIISKFFRTNSFSCGALSCHVIDRPVWIDSHRRGQWCVSLFFIRMPPARQRCDKVEAS